MQWCVGLVTVAILGCGGRDATPGDAKLGVTSGDVHVTVTGSPASTPVGCGADPLGISSIALRIDEGVIDEAPCTPDFQATFTLVSAGAHTLSARGYDSSHKLMTSPAWVDFTVVGGTKTEVSIELARTAI